MTPMLKKLRERVQWVCFPILSFYFTFSLTLLSLKDAYKSNEEPLGVRDFRRLFDLYPEAHDKFTFLFSV